MEEKDLGRVFALAAPKEVPPYADLRDRARARGRRERRFRTVLSAGGAGVAVLAVGGAIALGTAGPGRGTGDDASAASGGSGLGTPRVSTPAPTSTTAPVPDKPRGPEDHSPLSQAALSAFEAALPAGSHVTGAHAYGRSASLVPAYVAEIDVSDGNGHAYRVDVTATRNVPDRPRPCPSRDACGDATLDGDAAWWLYMPPSAGVDNPNVWVDSLVVNDPAGHRQFLFGLVTADRDMKTMDVLKHVGLNQQLAPALAAAIK